MLNVTFDPGTWTLTWSCGEHVTVKSCTATFTKSNGRLGRLKILVCGGGQGLLGVGTRGRRGAGIRGSSNDVTTPAHLPQDPVCHCQFKPLALHLGVTLEVNATVNHTPVLEKLRYVNRGGGRGKGYGGGVAGGLVLVSHHGAQGWDVVLVNHRARQS